MRKNKYILHFRVTGKLSEELTGTYVTFAEILVQSQTAEELYEELKRQIQGAIFRGENKNVNIENIIFTMIAMVDSEPINKENANI